MRQSNKVIEKLQEDDLGIVVSMEHDGVAVRHPDGCCCRDAEWKAGLVKAAEDVGVKMAINEYRSPDKILKQLRQLHPECGTEDSSALEIEQKRVNLGQFMMSSKECPELLLSELLMRKPVTVDGSEYLLSEVHQTVPESGRSQQAGRWMLHTEKEMEPVFLKLLTEVVEGVWKNDLNTEQRGPPAPLGMTAAVTALMKQLLNMDAEETRTYFLFADGWLVDRDNHEIKRCEPDLIMTRCSGMPFPEKEFREFEASCLAGSSSWTGSPSTRSRS